MTRADLPNALTGLRLAMAPVLPWLLWQGHHHAALVLAVVAGATDALDGWLARRYGWTSRLGSLLDPVADKAMLGLAVFGLWLVGMLPGWLLGLVLVRDAVVVAGAAAWWRIAGPFAATPTLPGKLSTLAQIALVIACLLELAGVAMPLQVRRELVIAVAVLTFASGVDYVLRYGLKAWRHPRTPR
jgi:cardiolipin synthase (CMP-forming)